MRTIKIRISQDAKTRLEKFKISKDETDAELTERLTNILTLKARARHLTHVPRGKIVKPRAFIVLERFELRQNIIHKFN